MYTVSIKKHLKLHLGYTKSFRSPFITNYMIETLSETEFAPSTKENWLDIGRLSDYER